VDDRGDWGPLDQITDSAGLADRIAFQLDIPGAQLVLASIERRRGDLPLTGLAQQVRTTVPKVNRLDAFQSDAQHQLRAGDGRVEWMRSSSPGRAV